MNMNINIIYLGISILFSFVMFLDNQINGLVLKYGFYIRMILINITILYFLNPFRFMQTNLQMPNIGVSASPF